MFPLLLGFARPEWRRLTLSCALAMLAALFQLAPFVLAYLVVAQLLAPPVDAGRLWLLAGLAVVAVVARFAIYATALWVSHVAAYGILYRLRLRLSEKLASLPLGYVTSRRSGEIKTVMGDQVEELEIFLAHAIPDFASGAAALVASTVILVAADWRLALPALVVVPLAFGVIHLGMRDMQERTLDYHAAGARMNGALVEFLQGMQVIRLFNRAGTRFRQTEHAVTEYTAFETRWARDFLYIGTFFFVALAGNVLFIVPIGLALIVTGHLAVATFVLFLLLGVGYTAPLLRLHAIYNRLNYMAGGGQMIHELLAEPPLPDAAQRARLRGHAIEFRDVAFSYGASEVLSGVSFHAREGEVTALVGPSGAGKTTVARLAARFWDVDAGAVLVGGVDVREIPVSQLMDEVSFVFQETFLFHDTLAANIALGKAGASLEDIERAARAARCHEFISALPDGYDTIVGERGATLSGGQRQRIAIARALLKDAPITILDEATAHADPENEAAIQEAIAELTAGKTLLVVAHRLSTIAGAGQILVMNRGRIVERGCHEELVAAGGLYSTLWEDHVHSLGWSLPGGRAEGAL
jgi:ATP-binding cassette, subfamily B, bacterial IrtA/YbtP